jgi:hypothetical protein
MNSLHNQRASQVVAATVTIIIELLFAFLGGWTLYDVFLSWGLVPSIIIGGLVGLTLFLLYLYVFVYREYALDAVKVFSARRGESPSGRLFWASFIVFACILMDSFFNADRMVSLSISGWSRFFIWAALQMMIFIPFALGKLAHAHVNVTDVRAIRERQIVSMVDDTLHKSMRQVLPSLNAAELLQLKAGNLGPLAARLNAVETEQKEAQAQAQATSPLEEALRQWAMAQGQSQQ